MSRAVAWALGLMLALVGVFVVVASMLPPRSVPALVAGLLVLFIGGYVIPNDAIRTGVPRFLLVVQPYVPVVFGGRRATDPPTPAAPVPPKETP